MTRVSLSQGEIEFEEFGPDDGPGVLFVHGLLVDGRLWTEAALGLSRRGFRCIVPTWPLGSHRVPMRADADLTPLTVAAMVAELCEVLDLRDVTLVGNDSGGAIAQLVATRHAECIARLVLTNCDAFEVFPPPAFGYLKWVPRVPGLMAMLSATMWIMPAMRRLPIAYGGLSRRRLPDALLAAWIEPAYRQRAIRRDTAKFIAGVSPDLTLAAGEQLRAFTKPALLAWGDADRFFSVSLGKRLRDAIPNARLVPIPGAGTFVALDDPDTLVDAIADFATPLRTRAASNG